MDFGECDRPLQRAIEVIRKLEEETSIWGLRVGSIPIWWFVRIRLRNELTAHFGRTGGSRDVGERRNPLSLVARAVSSCIAAVVFCVRCIVGSAQFLGVRKLAARGPVLFLSISTAFRGAQNGMERDIHFDSIIGQLGMPSIVVERPTLSRWDAHTLLFRRRVLFFDWLLACSIVRSVPKLCRPIRIAGWDDFARRCSALEFSELATDDLLRMLDGIVRTYARKAIVQVSAARRLIKTLRPHAIVEITSYDSSVRAVNLAAREARVPIVELQHGLINHDLSYDYYLPRELRQLRPLPDKVLVYGEAFRECILELSSAFLPGDIVVAGYPRLDQFLLEVAESGYANVRKEARRRLGAADSTQVLLVTTQPGTRLEDILVPAVRLLGERRDLMVCIKPHPSEAGRWQRGRFRAFQHAPYRIITDTDIDLYQLLAATDVHATVYSTVFLECLALSVPTIILGSCPGSFGVTQLLSEGEAVTVRTATEFAALVERLSRDAKEKERMVEDGRETARRFFSEAHCGIAIIVGEIQECARRHQNGSW